MTFVVLNLLFPVVLAIHNTEEYLRFDEFIGSYRSLLPERLTSRRVVRDAAILLTLAAAVVCWLTYKHQTARLLAISKVAILALMLNGVSHCILSVRRRRLMPGTLSAVLLVLPYAALAIAKMHTDCGDSARSFVLLAACGAIAVPIAVAASLSCSYGLSRMLRR